MTVAQLTGLKFAPDAGAVAQGSLFGYTITDNGAPIASAADTASADNKSPSVDNMLDIISS